MNDGYVTARLGPGKCDAGRPLSAAGACPGGVAGRHAGPYESCGRPQTLQRRFASASGQRPVASADCGGAALECGRLRPLCSAGACPGAFIVAVNHREHRDHREGTGFALALAGVPRQRQRKALCELCVLGGEQIKVPLAWDPAPASEPALRPPWRGPEELSGYGTELRPLPGNPLALPGRNGYVACFCASPGGRGRPPIMSKG